MLELKNIIKTYKSGDTEVNALRGVSLCFRKNEFVSILGASGCGKTTLLNIIGGLDRYTEGDLCINGRSTRFFVDADWDSYRNHSVGFVFQSYNLIPHQTVLSNVELALTLSGVSKAERRQRATEALRKVGLGDQLNKKPNQMSGGQMQRVAIARALVNDPDILLADEPTGALDTNTSVQIMELLKEVASDRLVIMVTHNPELAREYSTRIIDLSDGNVVGDSNPISEAEYRKYAEEDEAKSKALSSKSKKEIKKATKTRSMSFGTAISLSLKNLMTKKGRTVLTSFAGSIGIIGIALILALSNGIQLFINQIQEDTLSTYPLTLEAKTQDMSSLLTAMTEVSKAEDHTNSNKIYVDDSMGTMMSAMASTVTNNLEDFKVYLEKNYDSIKDHVSDIQYTYDMELEVFSSDGKTKLGMANLLDNMGSKFAGLSEMMSMSGGVDVMSEMIDNQELLNQQYEVVAGDWPKNANELVLVINRNNQISKMTLYMLGVLDQSNLDKVMEALLSGGEYDSEPMEPFEYDYFLDMTFKLLITSDFFEKSGVLPAYTVDGKEYPVWSDIRELRGEAAIAEFVKANGTELKISGIIRPKEEAAATSIKGTLGYTKGLTDLILGKTAQSEPILQQKSTPEINILTGRSFEKKVYTKENINELIRTIDSATMDAMYAMMTERVKEMYQNEPPVKNNQTLMMFLAFMSPEQRAALIESMIDVATQVDPTRMPVFYGTLNAAFEKMTIESKEDVLRFLPILDQEQMNVLLGTLLPICEPAMQTIYDGVNAAILDMTVDENSFITLLVMMDDAQFAETQEMLYKLAPKTDATYDGNLTLLGDAEKAKPASINIYSKDFASKDAVEAFIQGYNDSVDEEDRLQYTDMIGILLSSVSLIINVISYVLIAFVSISLVVSSIMIGIITNISVLERTKEIGILRAIGASKRDISRVFNAETFIVGSIAGIMGILLTLLLCWPTNLIIRSLSGFSNISASLPLVAAIILVFISMGLTMLSGLIPSKRASRKDPVEALRTE